MVLRDAGAGISNGSSPDPSSKSLPRTAAAPYRSKAARPPSRLVPWMVLLLCAAAAALLSAHSFLHSAVVYESPIRPHLDALPVDPVQHIADERMLRMVAEECAKGEDTIIHVEPDGTMVVQAEVDATQCPPLDIMLRGSERGIGMCTDVALYVLHAGARLVPAVDRELYESYPCARTSARMLLETMYREFLSPHPEVLHLMLVNNEHMWVADAELHRHINVFLCKTVFCLELLQRHIHAAGLRASVWLMGHTSSDPTVDAKPRSLSHNEPVRVLHVKGKSGLKHTNQLLECWRGRPDFPQLTVVGRFTWSEARESSGAANMRFIPPVSEANAEAQTQHVSFEQVRQEMVAHPIHLCPSEREGFGHYINEARAAGAFVLTTDHPPMNQLVTSQTGMLVTPERVNSYDTMALGRYRPINAFLSPKQLCDAVELLLQLPPEEVAARGRLAREVFLQEQATFLARMADLRLFLMHRLQGAHVLERRGGLFSGWAKPPGPDLEAAAHAVDAARAAQQRQEAAALPQTQQPQQPQPQQGRRRLG